MKLFTTLAVATLGLTSLFAPAANASTWTDDECGYIADSFVCVTREGNKWVVGVTNDEFSETFNIICNGDRVSSWESYGQLSQSQAERFVVGFCSA